MNEYKFLVVIDKAGDIDEAKEIKDEIIAKQVCEKEFIKIVKKN